MGGIAAPYTLAPAPRTVPVVKHVPIGGRVRAQLNVEFLNAFNHPVFGNPNTDPTNANCGKVTNQANLPRDIQIAAQIVF